MHNLICRNSLYYVLHGCPCGYSSHPTKACRCSDYEIKTYRRRISGPLLDRLDLQIEVGPVEINDLGRPPDGAGSAKLRAEVCRAREIQAARFQGRARHANAHMLASEIEEYCRLDDQGRRLLDTAAERLSLSARAYTRIKKIARTIADLAGENEISPGHLAEAIQYRGSDLN